MAFFFTSVISLSAESVKDTATTNKNTNNTTASTDKKTNNPSNTINNVNLNCHHTLAVKTLQRESSTILHIIK